MASEGLSARGAFKQVTWPLPTMPWTHNCLHSKCLTLPQPSRWSMSLAAELSVKMRLLHTREHSNNMFFKKRPSATPLTTAFSSASAELNATVACVEDQWCARCLPYKRTPPLVLRRVFTQPAQSESEYTVSCVVGSCHVYFIALSSRQSNAE